MTASRWRPWEAAPFRSFDPAGMRKADLFVLRRGPIACIQPFAEGGPVFDPVRRKPWRMCGGYDETAGSAPGSV